jgi:uncharacterized cofD-like protein
MIPQKKVVCLGGGTGTFTVLRGLKHYDHLQLSSIVTMSDSGGSTGKLRNDLRVLPPGDVRQSLIALSQEDDLMQHIFTYRFEEGDLRGHNLGNIILAGLEKITGSFQQAVNKVSDILAIKGKVIPVTLQKTDLVAELKNGQIVFGETNIDEPSHRGKIRIKRVFLSPKVRANKDALLAIKEAEMIVIGPGDLYTSIIPNLLVTGISQAIQKTAASIVYIANLMTKYGQTDGMTAVQHITLLERYLGRKIDVVLWNTRKLPQQALKKYAAEKEFPVQKGVFPRRIRIVEGDFLSDDAVEKSKADPLKRSLIRHSSQKLAGQLYTLLYG